MNNILDYLASRMDALDGTIISLAVIVLFAILLRIIIKFGLFRLIKVLVFKQSPKLMDSIESYKIFKHALNLAPLLAIYIGINYLLTLEHDQERFLLNIIQILLVIVLLQFINSVLSFILNELNLLKVVNRTLIRTVSQVIKILLFFIGIISIVSIILNKSPVIIFSSLGALSAILLLVFKDSILGFVASVQVSLLGIAKEGDWIEMPKYNADGTIIDINLSSIRVQNFDKTITTIPTYALVSEPVKNWQGMEASNCRRIKRSIYIDVYTIKSCSEELINKLSQVNLLSNYIETSSKNINTFNQSQTNSNIEINQRNLTNIGVFRKYIEEYIQSHPKINQTATILIRQLSPSEYGLPLEIYCFTSTTDWNEYEAIQSDIFDHLYAVINQFELKPFQLEQLRR